MNVIQNFASSAVPIVKDMSPTGRCLIIAAAVSLVVVGLLINPYLTIACLGAVVLGMVIGKFCYKPTAELPAAPKLPESKAVGIKPKKPLKRVNSSPVSSTSTSPAAPALPRAAAAVTNTTHLRLQGDYKGAGVMPYFIRNGEAYLILGKEQSGSGKDTFCDFGGDGENFENSPLETALREFSEESKGLLHPKNGKSIRTALKTAKFIISGDDKPLYKYSTFFVEMDSLSEKQFNDLRARFKNTKFADHKYMEKSDIIAVKATDILTAVTKNRGVFTHESKPETVRKVFSYSLRQNAEEIRNLLNVGV